MDEGLPELLQRHSPALFAARDGIEFILHGGREAVLDVAVEVLGEEAVYDLADVGRYEAPVVHLDVFAVLQGRDDRRIRRGAADSVFLERLDQGGLAVARRRLGEVLSGSQVEQIDRIAFVQRRQGVVLLVALGIVGPFLIDRDVPGLDQRRAGGAQQVPIRPVGPRQHVGGYRVENGQRHLRGYGPLPDERVQAVLIVVDLALDVRRRDCRGGRPDGLVRLLRVLRLGLEHARFIRDFLLAVKSRRDRTDFLHRFLRERHRVGAHVGDQADIAFAEVDALVQLLRQAHGAAGVEAELARRLLLQRRGGERRCGRTASLLAIDREHTQSSRRPAAGRIARGGLHRVLDLARGRLVGKRELLDFAAAIFDQLQRERRSAQRLAFQCPVFPRNERFDLRLSLADHAQRGALYASRGEAAANLLPQQGREVEADQVIERAARLLRVHQIERQLARVLDRLANRIARDLVERHPVHSLAVELAARPQDLLQVPGDGLAFPVRVGRQIEGFRFLQAADDAFHMTLVLRQHLVAHRVAVLRIDRAFLGHQVTHVPVRGQDLKVLAQVLLDGFRFRGRFDDDQILCHVFSYPISAARPCARRPSAPRNGRTRRTVQAARTVPGAPPISAAPAKAPRHRAPACAR